MRNTTFAVFSPMMRNTLTKLWTTEIWRGKCRNGYWLIRLIWSIWWGWLIRLMLLWSSWSDQINWFDWSDRSYRVDLFDWSERSDEVDWFNRFDRSIAEKWWSNHRRHRWQQSRIVRLYRTNLSTMHTRERWLYQLIDRSINQITCYSRPKSLSDLNEPLPPRLMLAAQHARVVK